MLESAFSPMETGIECGVIRGLFPRPFEHYPSRPPAKRAEGKRPIPSCATWEYSFRYAPTANIALQRNDGWTAWLANVSRPRRKDPPVAKKRSALTPRLPTAPATSSIGGTIDPSCRTDRWIEPSRRRAMRRRPRRSVRADLSVQWPRPEKGHTKFPSRQCLVPGAPLRRRQRSSSVA